MVGHKFVLPSRPLVFVQGQFQNAFGELVDADSYEIGESRTRADDGTVEVDATVRTSSTQQEVGLCFRMQKKEFGMREGSWMTKTIVQK